MATVMGREQGVGVVRINGSGVWALWTFEPGEGAHEQKWLVRMSMDELDGLGIHEYQRLRLKLGRWSERVVYFRARRDVPPWVWIELGTEVRR
jgi:hypothetical protein